MTINLFDDGAWHTLLPLTFTRPVADLRIGILTIAQKWEKHLNARSGFVTVPYLALKYPAIDNAELFINGSICPDENLTEAIMSLGKGELLAKQGVNIAYKPEAGDAISPELLTRLSAKEYTGEFVRISMPEDLFKFNDAELKKDFKLITKGRTSVKLSNTNTFIGDDIFAEEG
ncbi:MAG: glucose-1-phosphate thymidylyltransferase, partial [Pedobacter sp.]